MSWNVFCDVEEQADGFGRSIDSVRWNYAAHIGRIRARCPHPDGAGGRLPRPPALGRGASACGRLAPLVVTETGPGRSREITEPLKRSRITYPCLKELRDSVMADLTLHLRQPGRMA
jgi:hypothetical protein